MSFGDAPFGVVHAIAEHLDYRDVAALACTSRDVRDAVRPVLERRVREATDAVWDAFRQVLVSVADVGEVHKSGNVPGTSMRCVVGSAESRIVVGTFKVAGRPFEVWVTTVPNGRWFACVNSTAGGESVAVVMREPPSAFDLSFARVSPEVDPLVRVALVDVLTRIGFRVQ